MKREELGCMSESCFCTGRCRMTQEEWDASQRATKEFQKAMRLANETRAERIKRKSVKGES